MASQRRPQDARADPALGAVAHRLRASGVLDLAVGGVAGRGWLALDHVLGDVPAWHADLARDHGDRRAAAAYLATWLAAGPSLVVGLPALVGGVVPEVTPDALWLHRHPQGFVDGYAITPRGVGHGDGEAALADAGRRIAQLTSPLILRLCELLPVGPVALWGGVADAIGAYALWFARATGDDGARAWARAERLLDHLSRSAPVRYRPRLFPVAWSGGTTHYPVRCTCCLYYRTAAAVDAGAASYCSTCPLRSDESRMARIVAHLEPAP